MTDRELLELAAKATGLNWITDCVWWNPLIDDGDAFRLMVKLKFNVVPEYTWSAPWDNGGTLADPYAATRRAIVRAAAEIGRGMP